MMQRMTCFEWNLQDAGSQQEDDRIALGVVAEAAAAAAAYFLLVA
jgi:hypothetical protein